MGPGGVAREGEAGAARAEVQVEVALVQEALEVDGHHLDALRHVDGEVVVLAVADGREGRVLAVGHLAGLAGGERGLDLLLEASAELDMPIVTEVMDPRDVQLFVDKGIDIMQIGARNAQNFNLLKEVGKTNTPVLLKRGLSGTIDELLMAAEYVMSEGNPNVILCERGIRTFETRTRNTFDVNAIPVLHHLTHLPVVGDPSHATGYTRYVKPAAFAATAAGADGLEIEVHNCPTEAWSDGAQALVPEAFDDAMRRIALIREAITAELG